MNVLMLAMATWAIFVVKEVKPYCPPGFVCKVEVHDAVLLDFHVYSEKQPCMKALEQKRQLINKYGYVALHDISDHMGSVKYALTCKDVSAALEKGK